jgi:hypothetical protein
LISAKIHLRLFPVHLTDNEDTHEVSGNTVGECLEELSKYIGIFVNDKSAYPEELKKRAIDGDELFILMQIAGG